MKNKIFIVLIFAVLIFSSLTLTDEFKEKTEVGDLFGLEKGMIIIKNCKVYDEILEEQSTGRKIIETMSADSYVKFIRKYTKDEEEITEEYLFQEIEKGSKLKFKDGDLNGADIYYLIPKRTTFKFPEIEEIEIEQKVRLIYENKELKIEYLDEDKENNYVLFKGIKLFTEDDTTIFGNNIIGNFEYGEGEEKIKVFNGITNIFSKDAFKVSAINNDVSILYKGADINLNKGDNIFIDGTGKITKRGENFISFGDDEFLFGGKKDAFSFSLREQNCYISYFPEWIEPETIGKLNLKRNVIFYPEGCDIVRVTSDDFGEELTVTNIGNFRMMNGNTEIAVTGSVVYEDGNAKDVVINQEDIENRRAVMEPDVKTEDRIAIRNILPNYHSGYVTILNVKEGINKKMENIYEVEVEYRTVSFSECLKK